MTRTGLFALFTGLLGATQLRSQSVEPSPSDLDRR